VTRSHTTRADRDGHGRPACGVACAPRRRRRPAFFSLQQEASLRRRGPARRSETRPCLVYGGICQRGATLSLHGAMIRHTEIYHMHNMMHHPSIIHKRSKARLTMSCLVLLRLMCTQHILACQYAGVKLDDSHTRMPCTRVRVCQNQQQAATWPCTSTAIHPRNGSCHHSPLCSPRMSRRRPRPKAKSIRRRKNLPASHVSMPSCCGTWRRGSKRV
jgi:hypothetical protein